MAYTAQPVGFLSDIVQRIRDYTDDPSDAPKWTTDRLYPIIRSAYGRIIQDVNGLSGGPIVVRFDVTVAVDTQVYQLPPNVGTVLRVGRVDTSSNRMIDEVIPKCHLNPWGPGWSLEGKTLRFEPKLTQAETLRVEYIPNGEFLAFTGNLGTSDGSTAVIGLSVFPILQFTPNPTAIPETTTGVSITSGYLDFRPNAYVGSLLRVLSSLPVLAITDFRPQERIITAVPAGGIAATVSPDFDHNLRRTAAPDLVAYKFEVVPCYLEMFINAVALGATRSLHAIEERTKKFDGISQLYAEEMRSLRSMLCNLEGRVGNLAKKDVPENPLLSVTWGFGPAR